MAIKFGDCSNCESEAMVKCHWLTSSRLITECKICKNQTESLMSLGEAIEHFSLLVVRSKAGWLAGSFVNAFGRDEGYLDEEFGTIDGYLEPFAIAPTVAEAVAVVTQKTDERAEIQRLYINTQTEYPDR